MDLREEPSRVAPPGGVGSPERAARDDRLEILQEITLALNSTLDPERLLEVILDSSIRYTGATTGSVMLIRDEGYLEIVAARGLGQNVEKEVQLAVGEGITGWVALHGEPLSVPDVRKDERYVMVKEHIRSELAVPMVLDKRVVGVISVDSTREVNFSDDDLQLLTVVGTQAAQILKNAESYAELQRKNHEDATLLEISHVLGSAFDFEELFRQVMEILARRCQMTRGFLVLVQPETEELSIVVAHGMTPEEKAKGRYQKGEGIIGRVVRDAKPICVRDVRHEPKFLDRTGAFQASDEPISFMAIPVQLEGNVVGVFGAAKVFPGEEDLAADTAFLQIVASTLSQAVKIYRDAAQERALLVQENRLLREELRTRYQFGSIVGNSRAMQEVFRTVASVAPTRTTVLIRGESGTGKELIAHAIHFNSPRADRPFVRVNCAAIPEQLLEAELFGHVRGSFTGAVADHKGKFLVADGGTIFLDEIGDMSPVLQAKILRVVQDREVDTVGSEKPIKVDVRILAATHQDLEDLVRTGAFREDLYYRLNVVPVYVPPLRERPEDILVLAEHFLRKLREENDLAPSKISGDALRVLARHSWPGNVRELENAVERAAILSDGKEIRPSDLPPLGKPIARQGEETPLGSLQDVVARHVGGELEGPESGEVWERTTRLVERVMLEEALQRAGGVRLRAAELLGIHRNTLRKKLGELGL